MNRAAVKIHLQEFVEFSTHLDKSIELIATSYMCLFYKELLNCLPKQLYHFAFPPVKRVVIFLNPKEIGMLNAFLMTWFGDLTVARNHEFEESM